MLVILLAGGILWCVKAETVCLRTEHDALACKLEGSIFISKAAAKHRTWERCCGVVGGGEGVLTFTYTSSQLMNWGWGRRGGKAAAFKIKS